MNTTRVMEITEIISEDIIRLDDGNPYIIDACAKERCLVNLDTGRPLVNEETGEVFIIVDILHDDMDRPTAIILIDSIINNAPYVLAKDCNRCMDKFGRKCALEPNARACWTYAGEPERPVIIPKDWREADMW